MLQLQLSFPGEMLVLFVGIGLNIYLLDLAVLDLLGLWQARKNGTLALLAFGNLRRLVVRGIYQGVLTWALLNHWWGLPMTAVWTVVLVVTVDTFFDWHDRRTFWRWFA
jgi:hypothetical protein